ncbi:MAG: hypothetical protein GWP59_07710 [Chlamydiales bacterium]|nr:nuclear transport factor 2 family protein [Chlamydiales bacterium]NCF71571.1 hypothetical protein [Chlamydiales bacterium]
MTTSSKLSSQQLKELSQKYFYAFANKDLASLDTIFSSAVTLFDPIVQKVSGKKAVLEVNKSIFSGCSTIEFKHISLFINEEKSSVAAELEILFDSTKIVNVVDILQFNESGKITSIIAYLDSKQVLSS